MKYASVLTVMIVTGGMNEAVHVKTTINSVSWDSMRHRGGTESQYALSGILSAFEVLRRLAGRNHTKKRFLPQIAALCLRSEDGKTFYPVRRNKRSSQGARQARSPFLPTAGSTGYNGVIVAA